MLILAVLLSYAAPAESNAQEPESFTPEWGLGARAGVWAAEEAAPQIGGQVTLRPARWIQWLAFNDNSGRMADGIVQMDHVIGFHAVLPLKHWSGGFVGVSTGSCVDFRTWRESSDLNLLRSDVLFGPRVGLHLEHRLQERWSMQVTATGMLYIGNTEGTYEWGAGSAGLRANPVVQGQIGLTRWFAAR
ncbi:MAG: hypothetical protein AB8H79_02790 [Myxococcota bacterium]